MEFFRGKRERSVLNPGGADIKCVVPENIHTPPTEGIGISRGVGGSKAQENPEGGGGCCINFYYFFQTGSIIPIC